MTNPAGATRQVLGVGDAAAAPKLAEVARRLGTERTLVVHGDRMDELPLDDSGVLLDVTPGGVERREIDRRRCLGLSVRSERRARRGRRGTTRPWWGRSWRRARAASRGDGPQRRRRVRRGRPGGDPGEGAELARATIDAGAAPPSWRGCGRSVGTSRRRASRGSQAMSVASPHPASARPVRPVAGPRPAWSARSPRAGRRPRSASWPGRTPRSWPGRRRRPPIRGRSRSASPGPASM